MNKESKRVKYLLQNWSHLQLAREYEKLESIIKEVREFVEKWKCVDGDGTVSFDINTNPDDLLNILDKGEQNGK